jgi:hypothetical protein
MLDYRVCFYLSSFRYIYMYYMFKFCGLCCSNVFIMIDYFMLMLFQINIDLAFISFDFLGIWLKQIKLINVTSAYFNDLEC